MCFKYRSGASALKCLSDGVIYFAPPNELNDTLEAKFDFCSPRQNWELLSTTINELAESRQSSERVDPSLPPPEEFIAADDGENARFYEACQGTGIYSTAARPDNQAMWAYYSDSSKGVCLELEWSRQTFEREGLYPVEVNYTDQARQINRAEDERLLLRKIAAENPNWSIHQLKAFSLTETFARRVGIQSVARATSMKNSHWRHESEIRILSPKPGPRLLMKTVLKGVYYVRTDFPEWAQIIGTLCLNYPNVVVAQLSFSHLEPFARVEEQKFRVVPIPDADLK